MSFIALFLSFFICCSVSPALVSSCLTSASFFMSLLLCLAPSHPFWIFLFVTYLAVSSTLFSPLVSPPLSLLCPRVSSLPLCLPICLPLSVCGYLSVLPSCFCFVPTTVSFNLSPFCLMLALCLSPWLPLWLPLCIFFALFLHLHLPLVSLSVSSMRYFSPSICKIYSMSLPSEFSPIYPVSPLHFSLSPNPSDFSSCLFIPVCPPTFIRCVSPAPLSLCLYLSLCLSLSLYMSQQESQNFASNIPRTICSQKTFHPLYQG